MPASKWRLGKKPRKLQSEKQPLKQETQVTWQMNKQRGWKSQATLGDILFLRQHGMEITIKAVHRIILQCT